MIATNLGFPRIGPRRELKTALERYWAGSLTAEQLLTTGRDIRRMHWELQRDAGIIQIPSNDFSFYDHVLDTCALVGAVPERYGWSGERVGLDTYFRMARGSQGGDGATDVTAMEMTKWFDTNYHYLVPEFAADQRFRLASTKPMDEFREALALGIRTRPVLLGPVSFLRLGKLRGGDPLTLLDRLTPVYAELLSALADAGAEWVQMDEPCLALDLDDAGTRAYRAAYRVFGTLDRRPQLLLTSYFGSLHENLRLATQLPVDGIHVDLVRSPEQRQAVCDALPEGWVLSAGIVDGRNVWRNDLERSLDALEAIAAQIGRDRLWVAPSCSLQLVPVDLELERDLDPEVTSWLAFAKQKLHEVRALAVGLRDGRGAIAVDIEGSRSAAISRQRSARVHNAAVASRLARLTPADAKRQSPFVVRREAQRADSELSLLPTTTIGSFPQTPEIRKQRRAYEAGEISREAYERFLEEEIVRAVRFQEEMGLDVLVHGEPERNDMVQYFGEQLTGVAFTRHGWVQSYGSRCVRPPIIYGDVRRPQPMTVRWARYAQSRTTKPMKGMLTGPVTILQWSFARDDQSRADTCRQIALALRDEVCDLEAAGLRAIQIDEPALREGLPLRRSDWPAYLAWATECFRIASSSVRDATQIHSHMCYSEFGDIVEAIAALDADVLSIEASRSDLELLAVLGGGRYPNAIGPGVYDIHSPRVPTVDEIAAKLRAIARVLPPDRVWVNPDCGLKTRRWEEVRPALQAMVAAAARVREELIAAQP